MEREALRKINLIFGERIMKDGNAGNGVEFADGNVPAIVNGANVPSTINIIPGNTVTFSQGITGPVILTNGLGITLNLQGSLAPSTVTSFDDHLEVQPLGHVVSNDTPGL